MKGCWMANELVVPTHRRLPRWRGFNLLEKFTTVGKEATTGGYREDDFRFMAEHGFDFSRLPLDYRWLLEGGKAYTKNEETWEALDAAVEMGGRHGVHVNIAIHRAPGYCCNRPFEEVDLFTEGGARELFVWFWGELAKRYAGVDAGRLSFNLLNEPPAPTREQAVAEVMRSALKEIHAVRADRVVIVDGLCWGRWGGAGLPSYAMADDAVAQSVHCYEPAWLTFHKMNKEAFLNGPEPTWPGRLQVGAEACAEYPHELYMLGEGVWDKAVLRDYYFGPWRGLKAMGVGVHAGELSVFRDTPHGVALSYLEDVLSILKEMEVGWALWNLRGGFGVVNSHRGDAEYRETGLGKVDVKMLELLKRY